MKTEAQQEVIDPDPGSSPHFDATSHGPAFTQCALALDSACCRPVIDMWVRQGPGCPSLFAYSRVRTLHETLSQTIPPT